VISVAHHHRTWPVAQPDKYDSGDDERAREADTDAREQGNDGVPPAEGAAGKTMELTGHPDHVIRHEPGCCAGCGAGLDGAPETGAERRQVVEIPPVKAEVTEHQMIERQCAG